MATSTLGSGTLVLAGTTSGTTTVTATAVAGTTTLTLPAATDTLVGKATTDTLTNKTLTSPTITGTLTTTGNTILGDASTDTLNVGNGDLVKDTSGNLGIGTTAPYSNAAFVSLSIGGSSSAKTGLIALVTAAGTDSAHIDVYNSQLRISTNGTSNPIGFYTGGGVSQNMTLDSSGNLGVGTTTIGTKLVVAGTGQSLVGTAYNVADFTNAGQTLGTRIGYDSSNGAVIASSGVDKPIAFWQYNTSSSNYVERMRIDSSGNLGIGTTSPSASAILDAQSTTKGVRMPNMTTTQKNAIASPAAGLMVFDTTLAKLCVYSGSAWQTITSI